MSAGVADTVTTLRLNDTDRHELLGILLLAEHGGDTAARRLVDQLDAAHLAALAADRVLIEAIDDAEALDGAA